MAEALVIHEGDLAWETWSNARLALESPVVWKDLIGRDRHASDSLSLGIGEIPPGAHLSLHRHAAPEVYYVLAGEGIVRIDERDHPVAAGTAVYIPGNARHAFFNHGTHSIRFAYVFPVDAFADLVYEFEPGEHSSRD
ncbi:MAG TPA: cupin domain-containing protein [Roseiflexaceae bacterium]|nr:cupin domain-containing protein [Roseiflexaceae bacterium]